jgi:glycosyltransferase involved in cell wall biosynthesis
MCDTVGGDILGVNVPSLSKVLSRRSRTQREPGRPGIALLTGSVPGYDVCGVGDYTKRLHEHLGPRVELLHRPITAGVRWDLTDVFAKRVLVHVEYPTEGWGNSVLPSALPVLRLLLGRRARLLVTLHEWTQMNRLRRASIAPLVLGADGFIFVSPGEQRAFDADRWLLTRHKPTWHVPIGVNVEVPDLSPADVLATRTRELGGDHDLLLTHFGFINGAKQPEKLVAALDELRRCGRRPKLVFVGGFQAGKATLERELRTSVARRGLERDVVFRGFVRDDREAALLIAAGDATLALYADGLTRRRGSFWYATQLGCHVVSTTPAGPAEFAPGDPALAPPHVRLVDSQATPADVAGLLAALPPYEPLRFEPTPVATWDDIARAHLQIYEDLLGRNGLAGSP